MKYNKKLLGIVSAFVIAIPMSLGSVFANTTVNFTKVDSSTSEKVANAEIAFYVSGKKAFTFKTNAEGKVDPSSVASVDSFDVKEIVDADGNLNLKDGEYTYAETKAPAGYMLNAKRYAVSASNGTTSNVELKNTKFKKGMGQIIVKSTDKTTGAALGGATIDIKHADKVVATINFDNDGNVMDASSITSEGKDLGIEIIDGSISIKSGNYVLLENKPSDGYALNTQSYNVSVTAGQTVTQDIPQEKKSATTPTEKQTGLKLRIINTNKSAVSDQEVSIYAVDKDKKNPRLVFKGKTGADGYLDAKKATEGISLLKDGVVSLQPGNYYYKLTGGTKENAFTIEQDKVNSIDKIVNLASNKKNSKSSNNKKNNSKTRSSNLAKTGMVGGLAPVVTGGAAILAGGLVMTRRKK